MDKIICVVGPTASGKTALAVRLAREYDGEVLSFDSMQVYRRMDVGTAKPTIEERQGVIHHMLDVADPGEAFSVGRFTEMADPILRDILSRGKTAVLAGGTGLYVDALMAGRQFADCPDLAVRARLEKRADLEGTEALLRELASYDPASAEKLCPRDRKRILRAMEVYETTGQTISRHNEMTRALPPKYTGAWLGLWYSDRSVLYDRIDRRVDLMLQQGVLDEVRDLLDAGVPASATAMQAIGYKEFVGVLRDGADLTAAADAVKQGTRRYAKRQMTWFRRNEKVFWLDRCRLSSDEEVFSAARQHLTDFDLW